MSAPTLRAPTPAVQVAADRVQGPLCHSCCDNVSAMHAHLRAAGDIGHPHCCPNDQFRIADPDGYVRMAAHT